MYYATKKPRLGLGRFGRLSQAYSSYGTTPPPPPPPPASIPVNLVFGPRPLPSGPTAPTALPYPVIGLVSPGIPRPIVPTPVPVPVSPVGTSYASELAVAAAQARQRQEELERLRAYQPLPMPPIPGAPILKSPAEIQVQIDTWKAVLQTSPSAYTTPVSPSSSKWDIVKSKIQSLEQQKTTAQIQQFEYDMERLRERLRKPVVIQPPASPKPPPRILRPEETPEYAAAAVREIAQEQFERRYREVERMWQDKAAQEEAAREEAFRRRIAGIKTVEQKEAYFNETFGGMLKLAALKNPAWVIVRLTLSLKAAKAAKDAQTIEYLEDQIKALQAIKDLPEEDRVNIAFAEETTGKGAAAIAFGFARLKKFIKALSMADVQKWALVTAVPLFVSRLKARVPVNPGITTSHRVGQNDPGDITMNEKQFKAYVDLNSQVGKLQQVILGGAYMLWRQSGDRAALQNAIVRRFVELSKNKEVVNALWQQYGAPLLTTALAHRDSARPAGERYDAGVKFLENWNRAVDGAVQVAGAVVEARPIPLPSPQAQQQKQLQSLQRQAAQLRQDIAEAARVGDTLPGSETQLQNVQRQISQLQFQLRR